MQGGKEELYHHRTSNGTTIKMWYTQAVASHVYDTHTKLAKTIRYRPDRGCERDRDIQHFSIHHRQTARVEQ
jgi:hypothetical protein